jgi:hypothetical protein
VLPRWLRRVFGRSDRGWSAVNERAVAHLAHVLKVRESRTFRGDPVIEAEYQRAERIVRETGVRVDETRA